MALADKTSRGTGSVTSVAGLSSFLVEVDTAEDGNWAGGPLAIDQLAPANAAVDPLVPANAAVDPLVPANAAVDPLVPASAEALDLATVLHALSDPVRLRIVSQLAEAGERTCGSLEVPVAKSTCSHHFRVLREAGIVAQRVDGKCRFNRLRSDQLEQRFPGLLEAVLRAQDPASDRDRA